MTVKLNRTYAGAAGAFILGAVLATAGAKPEVIVKTVEVPGPQPTAEIIVKTVDVPGPTVTITPAVCITALNGLNDIVAAENDLVATFASGDVPTQTQVDALTTLDPDATYAAAKQCLALADTGS